MNQTKLCQDESNTAFCGYGDEHTGFIKEANLLIG